MRRGDNLKEIIIPFRFKACINGQHMLCVEHRDYASTDGTHKERCSCECHL